MRYYKILIIILFIIGLFIFNHMNASGSDLPLLGKVIFIDAGHQGIGVSQI